MASITRMEQNGDFFIIDGFFDNGSLYSFRFIGNEKQNILNYKEVIVSYDTFLPSSVKLQDAKLDDKELEDLKLECIDLITFTLEEDEEDEVENNEVEEKTKPTILFKTIKDSSFLEGIFFDINKKLLGIKFLNNDSLYLYKGLEYNDFMTFSQSKNKSKHLSVIKSNHEMIKLDNYLEISNFFVNDNKLLKQFFN